MYRFPTQPRFLGDDIRDHQQTYFNTCRNKTHQELFYYRLSDAMFHTPFNSRVYAASEVKYTILSPELVWITLAGKGSPVLPWLWLTVWCGLNYWNTIFHMKHMEKEHPKMIVSPLPSLSRTMTVSSMCATCPAADRCVGAIVNKVAIETVYRTWL